MNQKIITGFDMDGVLISDLTLNWSNPDVQDEIEQVRMKCHPIFRPKLPYVIITGRPITEEIHTYKWLELYGIIPLQIFFKMSGDFEKQTVINHKAAAINKVNSEPGLYISEFVESDMDQVIGIQKLVSIPVIHFSTFVTDELAKI
jgi:23S rRNA G2445 N2-methylase RlmL